jgi:hypothetical protein
MDDGIPESLRRVPKAKQPELAEIEEAPELNDEAEIVV